MVRSFLTLRGKEVPLLSFHLSFGIYNTSWSHWVTGLKMLVLVLVMSFHPGLTWSWDLPYSGIAASYLSSPLHWELPESQKCYRLILVFTTCLLNGQINGRNVEWQGNYNYMDQLIDRNKNARNSSYYPIRSNSNTVSSLELAELRMERSSNLIGLGFWCLTSQWILALLG